MINAYQLGASLYVPATHKDLEAVASGRKWPHLRSAIFCTEDAVAQADLGQALANLEGCLKAMPDEAPLLRFVRVRNPCVLEKVMGMHGAGKLAGFVFPKTDIRNIDQYFTVLGRSRHLVMPTLETEDCFERDRMAAFRDHMVAHGYNKRVLALRIGGNDLLSILGIRRPRRLSVYRTPLGQTIAQLVTTFKPQGFQLTAPVYEHIESPEILLGEIEEDLAHGLCGKTAIHPDQVPVIEGAFRVGEADLEAARRIIDSDQAVFRLHGSMCEKATHLSWASQTLARHQALSGMAAEAA